MEGDSLAVVLLSGVQYFTGQYFEIEKITAAAHSVVWIIFEIKLIKLEIKNKHRTLKLTGSLCRLGFSSCGWQCRVKASRLESWFCCVVFIQILKFGRRWHRWHIFAWKQFHSFEYKTNVNNHFFCLFFILDAWYNNYNRGHRFEVYL